MRKIAFIHANVIDGKIDSKLLEDVAVLVEGNNIVEVGKDLKTEGYKIIDLGGRYLLPGLINAHVHLPGNGMPKDTKKQNKKSVKFLLSNPITRYVVYLMCKNYAQVELYSGTTTIRCVGGIRNFESILRDRINKNRFDGPRILTSNYAISVPEGHMAGVLAYEAHNPQEGVAFVDKIAKTKPDLIKLMITGGVLDAKKKGEPGELKMSPEIVKACCDKAHELGYRVAAHVESGEGVKIALANGVDSIEHGSYIDDECIKLFKEKNAVHVLTISPAVPLAWFPKEVIKSTEMTQYNSEYLLKGMAECARTCKANGITVGLGTDTACPYVTHYDMYRELIYFHNVCGVSNQEAIHTATMVNAKVLGVENETGCIEKGKSADMLIVENNPLEDLKALATPYLVVFRGKLIKKKNKKFDICEENLDKFANVKF